MLFTRTLSSSAGEQCPFETLGLPRSSPYSDVRAAFLRLALLHHPDTAANSASSVGDGEEDEADGGGEPSRSTGRNDDSSDSSAAAKFIQLRKAFESIEEAEDGSAVSGSFKFGRRDSGRGGLMSEEEFEAWFHAETGHTVPYCHSSLRHIDPAVLRETAEKTEGMSPGGLDRGGMWQLAASLRDAAADGDLPPLRVGSGGAGNAEEAEGRGPGRRRRRRRR